MCEHCSYLESRAHGGLQDGKVYIGSAVEGLMVFDISTGRLLSRIIPTGGPVNDIAVTPSGDKLFLAMSMAGLKLVRIADSNVEQVSNRVCPQFLDIDAQGKHLYVSYQCSGPGGRGGQDTVEVFDIAQEIKLWAVNGLPMVGGDPSVSPDGQYVLLDGTDVCINPEYDRKPCPAFPSRVVHLMRPADRLILKSFAFPVGSGQVAFIDNTRFLLFGMPVSIVDARRYTIIETLPINREVYWGVAFPADRRRVYLGDVRRKEVIVLEPENPGCEAPQEGLTILYSADGTLNDAIGLTWTDYVGESWFRYPPAGQSGQAFFFDGSSTLVSTWSGFYEFGWQDSTLAMYVKFADLQGERVLLYRMSKDGDARYEIDQAGERPPCLSDCIHGREESFSREY